MATLVGTPPNLALVRLFELSFPDAAAAGYGISFGQWMLFGVPLSLALLAAAWFVLTQVCFRAPRELALVPSLECVVRKPFKWTALAEEVVKY